MTVISPVRATRYALAAVTVVAALTGAILWTQDGSAAPANRAHTLTAADNATETTLTAQVTQAVSAIFSYNYADPGKTSQAAAQTLTGPARGQYSKLMDRFTRPGGQLAHSVLSTTVTTTGVKSLSADGRHAHVLVTATQTVQVVSPPAAPVSSTAILGVDAVKTGGTWRITGIGIFS